MHNLPSDVTEPKLKEAVGVLRAFRDHGDGYLPRELFDAISGISVTATVELVSFVKRPSGLHVALTKREADDPFWPNMWHSPGSVIRPSDGAGFNDTVERIHQKELGNIEIIDGPHPFKTTHRATEEVVRGPELSQYMWMTIKDPEMHDGHHFEGIIAPVEALPEPLMSHHHALIQDAIRAYNNSQR